MEFFVALLFSRIFDPAVVILFLISTKSFNPRGIPKSGLLDLVLSRDLAQLIASSLYISRYAFNLLLYFFILFKKSSVTSKGEIDFSSYILFNSSMLL